MTESWRVDVLDRNGWPKGVLREVTGGSLSWSTFRAVGGQGSIDITLGTDIDLLNDRLRVTHLSGTAETPCGVFMAAAPSRSYEPARETTSIALLDNVEALNQQIGFWYGCRAGENIADRIALILDLMAGWPWISVAPSPQTTTTPIVWEPRDTWLKVVNDLAAMIGYGSVWSDVNGVLRCEAYVEPGDRPTIAIYGEEAQLKMLPTFSDEMPLWEVPNVVRLSVDGTDEQAGFVGVSRNDDPDSPFSTVSRGREIVLHESVEAADKATADKMAARKLTEAMQVIRRATITHPMDRTQLNDVVRHGPLGFHGPIVERQIKLDIGPVVTDTIRHIYTRGEALPWLTPST